MSVTADWNRTGKELRKCTLLASVKPNHVIVNFFGKKLILLRKNGIKLILVRN